VSSIIAVDLAQLEAQAGKLELNPPTVQLASLIEAITSLSQKRRQQ
jgi:hypothetical protein